MSLNVFVSGFLCVTAGVWAGVFAVFGRGLLFLPVEGLPWSGGRGGVCVCVCVCVWRLEAGLLTVQGVKSEFLWAGKFFTPESALWPPATQRSLFPFRESIAHGAPPEYLQTK